MVPGRFLHSALAALSVDATIAFFEAEGVETKVEETGKVFPVSNKATDAPAALLRRLEEAKLTQSRTNHSEFGSVPAKASR